MKLEAQRIAIAEALGWRWYRLPLSKRSDGDRKYRCLFLPAVHEYEGQSPEWLVRADGTERICNLEYMWKEGMVPNYPNDLNAMHDAEKILTDNQFTVYVRNLECRLIRSSSRYVVSAPADIRAECFLRTMNLWGEE